MHVVEVLGSGCQKCQYLAKTVREVAESEGIEAEVRHVTDISALVARGLLATPGLVIDGRLVSAGRVPSRDQLAAWLREPATT